MNAMQRIYRLGEGNAKEAAYEKADSLVMIKASDAKDMAYAKPGDANYSGLRESGPRAYDNVGSVYGNEQKARDSG
ncbi:hypothetical protein CARUB_v10016429mg [Capsella rubella]|uniref:Uncharacterized protein n=1 Tax=Capsella rubella TaxID=81985 RepID=R0GBW6_9BRAS|nr:hypothetical protein CARUB_v10016429mg [Capsella rubella]